MDLLIPLLCIVLVCGIVCWIVSLIPLPPPFRNIALVVVGLIMLIVVLNLFGFAGAPVWHARHW